MVASSREPGVQRACPRKGNLLKADNTSLRESCFGFELSKNALEPRTVFKVIWIIAWVERRFTKPGSQYVISYDAHCRVISRASSAGAQLQPRDACGLEGKASWDGEEKRGSDRQAFNLTFTVS